jgi:hypothetical protein
VPVSEIVAEGQRIFRFDTFGDEQFWTDKARLHEVIEQQLQPLEALGLGLKVDLDNLNLLRFVFHNPFAVSGTKELLRQNAVVGVQDGSAATLADVVAHYNRVRTLGLNAEQQRDLVEYLKSI